MNNTDLQKFYTSVYQGGEENYYSKFRDGKNISENDEFVLNTTDFTGKTVLDVGCGTGELAIKIANKGAAFVTGIDYAKSAIDVALSKDIPQNVSFQNINLDQWDEKVDIIYSCGTLEHMDKPGEVLIQLSNLLNTNGELIITCPHFLNLRGFIWVALQKLFNVPMSLTDLHSIAPFDIKRWIADTNLELVKVTSYDHERANGDYAVVDMKKRLTNALKDANMPNDKVDDYLEWMNSVVELMKSSHSTLNLEGGNALYHMKTKS